MGCEQKSITIHARNIHSPALSVFHAKFMLQAAHKVCPAPRSCKWTLPLAYTQRSMYVRTFFWELLRVGCYVWVCRSLLGCGHYQFSANKRHENEQIRWRARSCHEPKARTQPRVGRGIVIMRRTYYGRSVQMPPDLIVALWVLLGHRLAPAFRGSLILPLPQVRLS